MISLAIESSCDETSVALLSGGRTILANVISTQIETHALYGGVVPEIASRQHLEAINRILALALEEAGLGIEAVELVSVTRGPGLIGALLVGISAAKAIAFARDLPLVGVNHMEGHICANYLSDPDLTPPFITLVVSGGHTYLCKVRDYTDYEVVGRTLDDAAGESFDKVSRVLGMGYPGGPKIQRLAEDGRPGALHFPRAMMKKEDGYDFSFSGLKTAVINYCHQQDQLGRSYRKADVARGFQDAVIDVLTQKSIRLLEESGFSDFCLSGGVAANGPLRSALQAACQERGIRFHVPSPALCTDNAAMIGSAGYYHFKYRGPSDLAFPAEPNLGL